VDVQTTSNGIFSDHQEWIALTQVAACISGAAVGNRSFGLALHYLALIFGFMNDPGFKGMTCKTI